MPTWCSAPTDVETIVLEAGASYRLTTHDATVAGGASLTVQAGALGAGETLYFDGSAETGAGSRFIITCGKGDDTLGGGAGGDILRAGSGRDTLFGYAGDDFLEGGASADLLVLGSGADTVGCDEAMDSTSRHYDTVVGFNAGNDRFDLPAAVTDIDAVITSGRLSEANLNDDLAAAANAACLLANHAVLFTPDRGAHAGETFLLVDANGIAGYQAQQDFVFRLDSPGNLGSLSASTFT